MALRGKCQQVLGYDHDPQVVHLAQSMQVTEYTTTQLDEILPQANLLVLAVPVKQILQLLAELETFHPGPAVVLDVGSTKADVMAAMQNLPARFDPIGGHPICGKEKSSLAYAEAGIYRGTPFVLCRLPRSSPAAVELVRQLVEKVGAQPIWMEAGEHDRWIAATSHLPYLLANALVQATPLEAGRLVGPGYRSASRLAASYAPMLVDVLESNRDRIIPAIRAFRQELDRLEANLQSEDWAGIIELLQGNAKKYALLTSDQVLNTRGEGGEE